MKINSFFSGKLLPVFAVILIVMLVSCKQPSDKIPFDEAKALRHLRPYDTLIGYIQSFNELRSRASKNVISIDTSLLPLAESFNRDAIIALLNAPGAQNMRIYLGRKPNGTIAFCILPVDDKGNDIAVQLVEDDKRSALNIPGISNANAAPPQSKAQGLEEGQRCPTLCSAK